MNARHNHEHKSHPSPIVPKQTQIQNLCTHIIQMCQVNFAPIFVKMLYSNALICFLHLLALSYT
jgi:hypothetical protein